jgi:hypothetical protein
MFRKISIILIAAFLIVSGSLFAQQNAQELRFGTAVSGNLRSGGEIWYIVRAAEDCFIKVETTGDTDTYLEIYDSQRNLLMENDDVSEYDYNARIEMFAVRGSSYLVKLSAYGGGSGPFRIMSSSIPLSDAVELRLGSVLSRTLSSGQKQLFSIRTTEVGLYTVETTGNTDTYLSVYDASFDFVDSNDDGGENYNARIEFFSEAGQVYYLILSGYNDSESGPFRILAGFESITSTVNNTSRSAAIAINLGEPISVLFTEPGQSRWFVYRATRTVTFVVQTSGDKDTVLSLYDNSGNLLEENDDYSEESLNALISRRLTSGTYYIEVTTYGGTTGRCTLRAEIR